MRRRALLASPVALAALAGAPRHALAQPSEAQALRSALPLAARGDWVGAEAATSGQPLPAKIVRWLRLLSGPSDPDDAAGFLSANADWPAGEPIRRRVEALIVASPDDAAARRWGQKFPPVTPAFRTRLAPLLPPSEAAAQARTGWIEGPADEAFERRAMETTGQWLRPQDHAARFDRLAWAGQGAAGARLLPLLPAASQASARATLELLSGRDAPEADPASAAALLRRARLLRNADRDAEAILWWNRAGPVREPERAAQLWNERQAMARRTLRLGDPATALKLAAAHGLSGGAEPHLDALFVTGWLALRFNDQPAVAARSFQALVDAAVSPISAARGQYWLGRAAAAQGRDAAPHLRQAAEHPATYYGQLAILALGEGEAGIATRLNAMPVPASDPAAMRAFVNRELARAARLLHDAGERGRSRLFLLRLEQLAPDAHDRARAAALAAAIGRPDVGVEISRRAGPKDGVVLLEAGFPAPFAPPREPDPALALALMRQESNFDPGAVSGAGARGLMQLMPATARLTARRIGVPTTLDRLTADPQHNMQLGTAYLAEMLERFDQAVPLAMAAYNAGPHRVNQWLSEAGDPRLPPAQGGADPVDWVERIPFSETRNYVQRVIEALMVYRARFGDTRRHPVLALAGAAQGPG